MFMEREQGEEGPEMSTNVGSGLQSLVRRRAFQHMEEHDRLVQLICSLCLDGNMGCVLSREKEKNMETRI